MKERVEVTGFTCFAITNEIADDAQNRHGDANLLPTVKRRSENAFEITVRCGKNYVDAIMLSDAAQCADCRIESAAATLESPNGRLFTPPIERTARTQ